MKRIFSRFALLSLGCIGALALVMSFVLSSLLTRAAFDWEWENTAALVRREVRMAGLQTVFVTPGDPKERERWGRQFSGLLTSLPEVVRIKVWDSQARILWSDEPHLIGRQFSDNEELGNALQGKLEVEIKSLSKEENGYERLAFTTLAEVYVPIFSDDGRVLGVVEVYKTPERLLATIRWGRIAIWSISFAGALMLYLVMHPLLTHVYRKDIEEETLRAEAGRLEAEMAKRTEQLFQAQKMEAVGQLAGGIAHDFNNLLTAITGYAELALDTDEDDEIRSDLLGIRDTAERAGALTGQLLTFSRRSATEPRFVDLNELVASTIPMLGRLIGEDVELDARLAPVRLPVYADPVHLEQVILNLSLNGRDAMPNGGRLRIETTKDELGFWAVLEVSDEGVGMDEATRAHIFEPFFTTKDIGKGTGLGLSTVYAIVQEAEGTIDLISEPGQGTTFQIRFPLTAEEFLPADTDERPRRADRRGSETILVVEDEERVRELASRVLTGKGYRVLEASTGEEALRILQETEVELVLTDIVMPGMTGTELAEQLARRFPDLPIVFMSGYPGEGGRYGTLPAGALLIQKPFTPALLLDRVGEGLDRGAKTAAWSK